MRFSPDEQTTCKIKSIEALEEKETVVSNPTLALGDSVLLVPTILKPRDYIEFEGDGPPRICNANGFLLATPVITKTAMKLNSGENQIVVTSDKASSVKLRFTTSGNRMD